ncbi:TIGR04197 family type VII secretion effector [Enterococcus rivorum]|uniref:TIGR04197 family type VII secretion effector n=1 Tax=Enterococcus rivorum TaxID=762845 RepID=A0A1E5KT82_9ENTE|nr:TIGR04197 family type VII secretion effector [Enterococcus rivorum]MBP2099106.1 type VII secretion effector (TIGR04197 family) [Enterococcus rivorum]OEH81102.1 hypothetical protein BCR26_17690 [Enterococcus rivorum]
MGKKIKYNPAEFEAAISKFSESATNLSMNISVSISETDIEPYPTFKEIQEAMNQFLSTYKSVVSADVQQMKSIGNSIEEADKRIGGKK